jgi:hypothetical protein
MLVFLQAFVFVIHMVVTVLVELVKSDVIILISFVGVMITRDGFHHRNHVAQFMQHFFIPLCLLLLSQIGEQLPLSIEED